MAAVCNRSPQPSCGLLALGGHGKRGGHMRVLVIATAAAAIVGSSVVGSGGAASGKPYAGSWKARVTADLLIDNGIAQPQFKGMWRLQLNRDGSYRAYNPWDKWFKGTY